MSRPRSLAIFARRTLAGEAPAGPALLLEGDWPDSERGPERWSLDAEIDARDAWMDREATRLAEAAADGDERSLANTFALKLRYYFVRLLRVVAFFERELPFDAARLVCESPRDDDYAWLLEQLLPGRLRIERRRSDCPAPVESRRSVWRRAVGWGSRFCQPRRAARRVLLCGNPQHLESVADAFRAAGYQPWWLYETPALQALLKRRPLGEGQLGCRRAKGQSPAHIPRPALPELGSRGIDLREAVANWLEQEAEARRAWLKQTPSGVEHNLAWLRPACVVLDQDATPLARWAVAAARSRGIPSLVVQHGAPCVRFGFAPLAADRFCAWGEPTRQSLIDWGVDPERVVVTGCPRLESQARTRAEPHVGSSTGRRPRLLLLATVPPRDARPDAVEFHLTTRAYRELLSAVGEVAEQFGAELLIRPHPRGGVCEPLRALLARGARLAPREPLEQQVAWADCVLSCASSAGLEAAQQGAAVVNLMPAGSGNLFEHPSWGLAGTARNREQLSARVERCLRGAAAVRGTNTAFDVLPHRTAAERVMDCALELVDEFAAEAAKPSPPAIQRQAELVGGRP